MIEIIYVLLIGYLQLNAVVQGVPECSSTNCTEPLCSNPVIPVGQCCLTCQETHEWGFVRNSGFGPKKWADHYPACGGTMQSPIDILTGDVLKDPKLEPVDLSAYEATARNDLEMMLVNSGGHTAKLKFKKKTHDSAKKITIYGGSLPHTYSLDQLHFHWGHDDTRGSDHTLDGKPAPAELHLVHHQDTEGMNTVTDAFGLAVVGFFFKISTTDNPAIETLIKHFDKIIKADQEVTIPNFKLSELLPSMTDGKLRSYYRYYGSLTTPPCYESVIWTVAKDTIPISKEQLAKFRTLKDDSNKIIGDVYRPTMPLNKRRVSMQTTGQLSQTSGISGKHVVDFNIFILSLTCVGFMNVNLR